MKYTLDVDDVLVNKSMKSGWDLSIEFSTRESNILELFKTREIIDHYGLDELLSEMSIDEIANVKKEDLLDSFTIRDIIEYFGEDTFLDHMSAEII